jgi:hypothetical protein
MVGGTYEYDGVWRQSTMVGPPDRVNAAMTYDPLRQECVLFGGAAQDYTQELGDTYRYRAINPATVAGFGQGCAGSGIAPGFIPAPYQVPDLGMPFGCNLYALPGNQPSFVALGASRTSFFGALLPLSLDVLGMTGCLLHVSLDVLLPAAGSGRSASLALTIPTQNSLVGRLRSHLTPHHRRSPRSPSLRRPSPCRRRSAWPPRASCRAAARRSA